MDWLKFLCILFCAAQLQGTEGSFAENEIVKKILSPDNYNKDIVPQTTLDGPLVLKFGYALNKLIGIEEAEQTMKASGWLRMTWVDERLKYTAESGSGGYENVSVLRISHDSIWTPSIRLANAIDDNFKYTKSKVLIYPSGEVLWVPPVISTTSCTFDPTYFPHDQQTCILKFYVDTYDGNEVSLALYNDKYFADLSDYWKSSDWFVIEVPAYLNVYNASTVVGVGPETDITFYVTLRRKCGVYTVALLLPIFLLSLLFFLTLFLPNESREKVVILLASIISLIFILTKIRPSLPSLSLSTPPIIHYITFLLTLQTVSLLATSIVLNLSSKTTRIPELLRSILINTAGPLVLLNKKQKDEAAGSDSPGKAEQLNDVNCTQRIEDDASKATTDSKAKANRLEKQGPDGAVKTGEDWKDVATVIDRIQLVLFFIVVLIGTIGIFHGIPHLFEPVDEDKIIEMYKG